MHQRRGHRNDQVPEEETSNEQLAFQETPSASGLIVLFAKKAWSSPKVKIGLVLWIIGISFMTWMPALVKITPEMQSSYENMAVQTSEEIFQYNDALSDLAVSQEALYQSQVWFWRFRPEFKAIVDKNQEHVSIRQAKVDGLKKERAAKQSKANSYVGIWSEYGMQEAKERFWSSFEGGKVFAQRQTFWQMFYDVLSSRDEYLVGVLLRWVFMALINFTLGLVGSLFYYAFTLFSMITSYQTDPLSAIAFFLLSLLGGASIVATYLFGLYGMAASGVYVVGKVAVGALKTREEQRLLRERQGQGQRQRQGLEFERR